MSDISALLSRGFRTGTDAAKESATSSTSGRMVEYLKMADGDLLYCRFLTDYDEIVDMMVHVLYPTKSKPEGYTGNWPKAVSPVCRHTKMGDGSPMFPDCYACEHPRMEEGKAKAAISRTYGLIVTREEVLSDGSEKFLIPGSNPPQVIPKGQRAGWRNKMREHQPFNEETQKPEGPVEMVPEVLIVEMGWKNFWSDIEGIAKIYGTVCNQEMTIRRTGSGMSDTEYKIIGLGVTKHDMRDAKVLERFGITVKGHTDKGQPIKEFPVHYSLPHILYAKASDDFYARWIDPTKTVEMKPGGQAEVVVKTQAEEVTEANLQDMRERLRSNQAKAKEAEAEAATNGAATNGNGAVIDTTGTPVPVAEAAPTQAAPEEVTLDTGAGVGEMNFDS
jgi:hypothetical protein